jgi:predicted MFS family arabinose efflux permease
VADQPHAAGGFRGVRSRAALFALALVGFCSFLGFYATMPLLPLLQQVFGASKSEVALTVSAPTIAVALASPLAGLFARRFGFRRTILASLFFLPTPLFLAATAGSMHVLVAWRFLQGIALPGAYAVTLAYLASEWPAEGLGRATSAFLTGNVVGGFSGRFLAGIAAEHLGSWRAPFVALGAITLVGAAIVYRLLPPDRASPGAGAAAERARPRDLFGEPRLLATFAVGFLVLFSLVATFTYVTFHLAAPPFGLSTSALSYLFTVYLVGAVVTPFAGLWIDRVGSRSVITVALAVGIGGGALTLAPSLALVVAGLTVVATAVFVAQTASATYLRTAAPPRAHTAASGMYVSCYYLGGALGGVVPALAWRLGGWTACVILIAGVQAATIAVARRAWRSAP